MLDDPQMPAKLPRCGEWIGALVTFPSYVSGEGEPYKPTAVMWLEPATGCVVDSQLVRPEQALPRAAGLFHLATREPLAGAPRVPARVRVSDEALAHALRGSLGDVELVIAPTPEVDDVVASLTAHIAQRDREDPETTTYLGPDLEPGDLAHLFAAAARLYRARPWDSIPADAFVSVGCERLGFTEGALCVVGQMGESFGFSLFESVEDAGQFLAAAERSEHGSMPSHFMFMFDDRRELPELLVQEIAEHRWEIAGPQAYPTFVVIDEDLVSRGLTREEHVGLTAVVTALAELVETEPRLDEAWRADKGVERTAAIETARGTVRVTVAAPLWLGGLGDDAYDEDEPATWPSVLDEEGELDEDMFDDYFDDLMTRFEEAPEATEEVLPFAEMLVEHAAMHFGATIAGLRPDEMTTLLFEIIPNKVLIEADVARLVIVAMRGLLTFADRELGAKDAKACLAALGPDAVSRLARELADERNFGIAKSMFVDGKRAGFDMTSEAGISAFVSTMNRGSRAPKRKAKPAAKAKAASKAKSTAKAKTPAKAKAASKAKTPAKAKPAAKATVKTTATTKRAAKAKPSMESKPAAKSKPKPSAKDASKAKRRSR